MMGLHRLQEKIRQRRDGEWVERDPAPAPAGLRLPFPRMADADREASLDAAQLQAALDLGKHNG